MSEPEAPRFRRIDVRRRRPTRSWPARELLGLAILVGLPASMVLYVFLLSSFRLSEVVVEGASRRGVAQGLQEIARPLVGENLLLLPLDQLAERFQRNPWVASVELQKEVPNRLRVIVTERRPIGLLTSASGFLFVDGQGRLIAPVTGADEVKGWSVLSCVTRCSGKDIASAFRVPLVLRRAVAVRDMGPIEYLGDGDVRIRRSSLPFAILLNAPEAERQLRKLEEVLPEIVRQYRRIETVDLRFDGEIVLRTPTDNS